MRPTLLMLKTELKIHDFSATQGKPFLSLRWGTFENSFQLVISSQTPTSLAYYGKILLGVNTVRCCVDNTCNPEVGYPHGFKVGVVFFLISGAKEEKCQLWIKLCGRRPSLCNPMTATIAFAPKQGANTTLASKEIGKRYTSQTNIMFFLF